MWFTRERHRASRLSEAECAAHPSLRRWTRRYRAKRRLVRDLWLLVGVLMLLLPPVAQLALALPTAFLAFVILDETP